MPIPLRRHIEYARGYLTLGMLAEAASELEQAQPEERKSIDLLRVRIDLHMERKEWDNVIALAPEVCTATPADEGAWIAWAFALHELKQTSEARDVLLKAEPLLGSKCSVLQYNLACYACVLGNTQEAKKRLAKACRLDPTWRDSALNDPDLAAMKDFIATLS